ncbi:MAG: ankyrin repeat domain-containing protein [Janthinobacterium lividum]
MDAELWAQWEAGWRRMENTARRRGWQMTPLAIARPASPAALQRLEVACRQPVPPQLRAALRRSARVGLGWHVPSHLQAMERDDLPTGSANQGAVWDLDHIENHAVPGFVDWRHTLAAQDRPGSPGDPVAWDRLFPFYALPNGDLLAIDAAPKGPQPVRYVSHELDMLHGVALAPDFFGFITEMSKLGFAGTEWASWLRFGVPEGDAFHLRADSEGGKAWLAWLDRDPAVPVSGEPPPAVAERTPSDTALLLAARANDAAGVRTAVEAGATPDATWNDGARMGYLLGKDEFATALSYAVRHGNGPMLDLLLAHGASTDTRRLAVEEAVEASSPEILARLLARGARVNGWKGQRHWPLHLLVTRRGKAVAATRDELEARLRAQDREQEYPGLDPEVLAMLRQGSEELLQRDLALHLTPEAYLAMLDGLLAAGADPDAPWDNGLTMLMQGDAPTVRALLRHGADVHARDSHGSTALHGARTPEIARLLVEHGADVNAPTIPAREDEATRGATPLQLALLTSGRRSLEMPDALIELGADPTIRDGIGRSTLGYCTGVAGLHLIEPYGLDPLQRLPDGGTLLHNLLRMTSVCASRPQDVAMLDHLLGLGLDINATDGVGQTMLHVAATRVENPADIQLLLDRGVRDARGRRPKDLARRSLKDVRALL